MGAAVKAARNAVKNKAKVFLKKVAGFGAARYKSLYIWSTKALKKAEACLQRKGLCPFEPRKLKLC